MTFMEPKARVGMRGVGSEDHYIKSATPPIRATLTFNPRGRDIVKKNFLEIFEKHPHQVTLKQLQKVQPNLP